MCIRDSPKDKVEQENGAQQEQDHLHAVKPHTVMKRGGIIACTVLTLLTPLGLLLILSLIHI